MASTLASLHAALAVPDSKSSANTVLPPWRTTTLSMPQLSSAMPCSPPSLKRIAALSLPAVKGIVTWR